MSPLNLIDYEAAARESLSPMAYDYFAGGSDDEITLRRNREAYGDIMLRHRVLVGVEEVDTTTTVLGTPVSQPVLIAPMSVHRLAHPAGEIATIRAAAEAGTVMVLSTLASTSIEDALDAAAGPVWFQLYVYRDRGFTAELVGRASEAGVDAIVLTVDAPWLGNRERDVRNSFHLPDDIRYENLRPVGLDEVPEESGTSGLATHVAAEHDASLTWDDVSWVRSLSSLPLLIKGIVRGDDAGRAVDHGADAVVVSNHGGRQLDTAPPTIRALPEVAERVAGRCEVLVDGGVRRGTDVVKAVALGARAVLVGRPILWGLVVDGQDGVSDVLALLRRELELAMALCGCRSIPDITMDLIG